MVILQQTEYSAVNLFLKALIRNLDYTIRHVCGDKELALTVLQTNQQSEGDLVSSMPSCPRFPMILFPGSLFRLDHTRSQGFLFCPIPTCCRIKPTTTCMAGEHASAYSTTAPKELQHFQETMEHGRRRLLALVYTAKINQYFFKKE